ncbi:MAG: hypothetical protein JWM80_2821 [Cyanobacteria bacterium RYN_339]|nr:hypothetical protein [Cyanobacteria bacterium RYN_339]
MQILALSKPFWHRQVRNPVGVLALLGVPLLISAIWVLAGGPPDRFTALMLLGWTLGGLLPAALNTRRDDAVELRWRTLPVGAAERWVGAFLAMLPLPLVTSLLLVMVDLLVGPGAQRSPHLFTLAAMVAAVMVAGGLAIGSWSRSPWQVAGGLGVALVLCAWALLPGASGWPMEVIPTGQAKLGLLALAKDPTAVLMSLLKLGLIGTVLAVVGIAGTGRR